MLGPRFGSGDWHCIGLVCLAAPQAFLPISSARREKSLADRSVLSIVFDADCSACGFGQRLFVWFQCGHSEPAYVKHQQGQIQVLSFQQSFRRLSETKDLITTTVGPFPFNDYWPFPVFLADGVNSVYATCGIK